MTESGMALRPFSLIVCTRGRPVLLQRLLLGIAQLRYPNFELIVICDPQDGETAQCLARHAARIGHCASANLAKARNIGLAMARGEIVAFIDDDAVPEPDWLDRLEAEYGGPEVTAVGGFIRGRNGIDFQNRVTLIDGFGAERHCRRLPPGLPRGWFAGLTGTNFSVRRSAALELGGFDENYAYFLEETDFLRRLVEAGGRVGIAADAEVHHGWAASDLRGGSGAPKSLYAIARSKAYFCHINRRPETRDAAIALALLRFTGGKFRLVGWHLLAGRLNAADAGRLLRELRSGLRDGVQLAKNGRALPDFAAGPAVPFEPNRQTPRRRLCVLAETAPDGPQFQLLQSLAQGGYEITVICFGTGRSSRVSFAGGIWQHVLAQGWRRRGNRAAAVAAELRRIAGRRDFQEILVASEDPALRSAAAASGLPAFIPPSAAASPVLPE